MYQIMYQMKKHSQRYLRKCFIFSVPARARTVDPLIKSRDPLTFGYLYSC